MERTIKEWFDTIEDPEIRDKAITNTNPWDLEVKTIALGYSLRVAFSWKYSPEKYEYWDNFMTTLINNK
jgi:hypothetical protein